MSEQTHPEWWYTARARIHQGMDDEEIETTFAQAQAEFEARGPEPPESDIARACRIASGDLRGEEVVQAILATHPPNCPCRHHLGASGE